ncbi:sigma-54 interaction domain-containing protein [Fusibacter ferrireducens]|uniref:HTH-type transcriptional regulatory protein TyrR n=1 Tax=Fusibacter ferrireducens TaxID=2785058 RepID=A0ABR9ZW63_9FIRM|nr:sigma 54-interacting transcriptional regulator [Fusibacter ferrireducens]MBF4694708.1 sigma 54-interacting transcriptional regulator [Fusibacter ferrireducens]
MVSLEVNEILESIFCEGSVLSFFNTLDKGLMIIDKNENIIFANNRAQKQLNSTLSKIQEAELSNILSFGSIVEVMENGRCFCNIKASLCGEIHFVNISPIDINLEIVGAAVVFENTQNDETFVNTLKLCNCISRELESVFNSSYDEIIVTDAQGNILKVNEAYKKLYNGEMEDFIGKNVFQLEKKGIFNPSVTLKVIREQKRVSITQKTNSGRVLIVTGYPLYDEKGTFVSVISTAKDITEVHILKEQLSEAKKTAQDFYYQLDILRQKETQKESMISKSPEMKKVMITANRVARVDSNVLITGESGVGKSMLANEIHKQSDRSENAFVSINCGAIPAALLESELFGYESGAFTGARKEGKQGQLSIANNGTLFLDEISELPLQMQVKILKAIQEKKFTRVGGTETLTSNFRLITATNKDLKSMVKAGTFREDLFYRLNVIPIEIPPLRERKQDIIMLTNLFWERLNAKYGTNRKIDLDVYEVLADYDWPGNVRDLENCIERIMVTVDKDIIRVCDLPVQLLVKPKKKVEIKEVLPLKKAMEETEKSMILKAYEKFKNTYKTAEALGVSQSTVVRKLRKYGCCDVT